MSLKRKDLNADEGDEKAFIDKFVWNPSNAQAFKDSFDSNEARTKLEYAINMINVDINKALRVLDEFIKEMAKCMKKRVFFFFFQISTGSPVNGLTLSVMLTEEMYGNNYANIVIR